MVNKFDFDIEAFRDDVNLLCMKKVDFLDALLTICEKRNIELETIIPLIRRDADLKLRLFNVGNRLNFMKKESPQEDE